MPAELTPPLSAEDHVRGPADAPFDLLMYGDYECPFCQAAQGILARVEQRMAGELRFAFRNFPLPELHPQAQRAAQWAEAAGRQGRFWEAHDVLYRQQGRLGDRDVLKALRRLDLDRARLEADVDAEPVLARIAADLASGQASQVPGTPAFFSGGQLLEGAFDAASLMAAIRAAGGAGAARA